MVRELGISVSRLHHHFKAVTAMSPLQFQKKLRLQEARRLMLAKTWTQQARRIAWMITMPPTSVASTKASSASRQYTTCSGEENRPWKTDSRTTAAL